MSTGMGSRCKVWYVSCVWLILVLFVCKLSLIRLLSICHPCKIDGNFKATAMCSCDGKHVPGGMCSFNVL